MNALLVALRATIASAVQSMGENSTDSSMADNMDRFVRLSPHGMATFIHNGQIGGFKSADVIETVSLHGDGLKVDSSGIHIGTVYTEKILYLDDEEVSELVYNLIEYALLREETRKAHRSKG